MKEKNVQNLALLAVGSRRDVMAMRNHTGVFRAMDYHNRIIKVGTPGAADALMCVAVTITPEMVGKTVGVFVAPEFKTHRGAQSEPQKLWQHALEKRGGVYKLIRTPDDLVELVEKVKTGDYFK